MTTQTLPILLKTKEAAKVLNICTKTLRRLPLKRVTFGQGCVRYCAADLAEYLMMNTR